MATTKAKQSMIEKVADGALNCVTKANDFALNTTEKAFYACFNLRSHINGSVCKVERSVKSFCTEHY